MGLDPEQRIEPDRETGTVATCRTATSTPGMNDDRSNVSWRIVSVWPVVPSTPLGARPPLHAHRVHPDSSLDEPAARLRPPPSSVGSAAHCSHAQPCAAVVIAVPDGASTLVSWWSSMISAVSNHGARARRSASSGPHRSRSSARPPRWRAVREELGALVEVVVGEAGGADDRVHVVRGAPAQVLARRADHGEVDARPRRRRRPTRRQLSRS